MPLAPRPPAARTYVAVRWTSYGPWPCPPLGTVTAPTAAAARAFADALWDDGERTVRIITAASARTAQLLGALVADGRANRSGSLIVRGR